MDLNKIFNSRAVAVIGASPKKEKLGYSLVFNLLQDKKRKVYPVNPNQKKVLGLTCFTNVSEIKGKIDLAVIAVKAEIVPLVLKDCGRKKIPFVIIISAGFKEIGRGGERLEKEIIKIAKKYRIKILGPNCLGLLDSFSGLNASFASEMILKGEIAFLSQSGALCSSMLDWAKRENIGFSKFVSLGNEAVLTENDFLEFLLTDKKTKAILMYLEGVSQGRKFLKITKKIIKTKPLVILKAGKTKRAQEAIASHTGSLSPEDKIFSSVCQQNRIIKVDSLRELFNFTKIFNAGIFKPLNNLAVITNGGGPSILMSDLIESSEKLSLARISEKTKKKLRKILPLAASVNNPIDILGDALSSRYEEVLKILTAEKNINGLIVILTPQKMTEIEKTALVLAKFKKKKPLLPVFIGEKTTGKGEEILKKKKVGNFEYPVDVKEILEKLAFKKKPLSAPSPMSEREGLLMEFERTKSLLQKYKISMIPSFLAKEKEDLKEIVSQINFPWAMKINSFQILHRTDYGGVKLDIRSLPEAEKAREEIIKNIRNKKPEAEIKGVIVQEMARGKEVIIGMKRDRTFGPVVAFGLGGIFVEVFKDVSLRIAPLLKKDVQEMIEEIKGFEVLKGQRGEEAVNFKALEKIILSLSSLSLENKEIKEIDLNPVIIDQNMAWVVDAKLVTYENRRESEVRPPQLRAHNL